MDWVGEPFVASGQVAGLNGTIAFFKFRPPDQPQVEEYCYFRNHRVFVDGEKVKGSDVRNNERFKNFYKERLKGRTIFGEVVRRKEAATFSTEDGVELHPLYFSHCVWLGDVRPSQEKRLPKRVSDCKQEGNSPAKSTISDADFANKIRHVADDEVAAKIDGQKGKLVRNSQSGFGIIEFAQDEEAKQYAVIESRALFNDGKLVDPAAFASWKVEAVEELQFDAFRCSHLPEYIYTNQQHGMEVETRLRPHWKCFAAWIGATPSADQLESLRMSPRPLCKRNQDSGMSNVAEDHEYVGGRLSSFLDRTTGVMSSKDKQVLFKLADLSVDGCKAPQSERLSAVLSLGDKLFAYCKPLVPNKMIDDNAVTLVAVQIWRGKKAEEKQGSQGKATVPPPSQATHIDQVGTVTKRSSKVITAVLDDQPSESVYIPPNRIFLNGEKLHCANSSQISEGEKLHFDMIRADPAMSMNEYEWLGLLAWVGRKPDPTLPNKLSGWVRGGGFRARITAFDPSDPGMGVRGGLLQVTGGPNSIGERVWFSADNTYVFMARMQFCDLRYLCKVGDKVQLEMAPLQDEIASLKLKEKYGDSVNYVATLVWIGPLPKANDPNLPDELPKDIHPFLERRGMDEQYFRTLVRGEVRPKSDSEKDGDIYGVTPTLTYGRPVELCKPDPGCITDHCIIVLENGPFQGQKAFLNRTALWCFGQHMAKADLMYIVSQEDRYCVEVNANTNNKSVPCNVTMAYVGSHPSDRTKPVGYHLMNVEFNNWLASHHLTFNEFKSVSSGSSPPKPFFPLPLERQSARVLHIYPYAGSQAPGDGASVGILRIVQGSLAKKDVLFERDSVYLWNVHWSHGDLNYLFKKGQYVFCEVIEVSSKAKKKWQSKLGVVNIPKFCASLVYIGGGRPKCHDPSEAFLEKLEANKNLQQWLTRRGIGLPFFKSIVDGQVPPPPREQESQQLMPAELQMHHMGRELSPMSTGSQSSFVGTISEAPPLVKRHHNHGRWPSEPVSQRPQQHQQGHLEQDNLENPIITQAKALLSRVMTCTSPEDPRVETLLKNESEVRLALFVSKTMEAAVEAFRASRIVNNQARAQSLGPIGPPRSSSGGCGGDNSWVQSGGLSGALSPSYKDDVREQRPGLYGLSRPLLSYGSIYEVECEERSENTFLMLESTEASSRPAARRESPKQLMCSEPPYKRKPDHANPFEP